MKKAETIGLIQKWLSLLTAIPGLFFKLVSWEDMGRAKNSCMGPNITDIYLAVDTIPEESEVSYDSDDETSDETSINGVATVMASTSSNYVDTTQSQRPESFHVIHENKRQSLKDFVTNLAEITGIATLSNMWCERDNHSVIYKPQVAVIPLSADTTEVNTSIVASSYTRRDEPNTVMIMATFTGTSVAILHESDQQLLINDNGTGRFLKISANPEPDGSSTDSKSLDSQPSDSSDDSSDKSIVLLVQIPINVTWKYRSRTIGVTRSTTRGATRGGRPMERAKVEHGKSGGKYTGLSYFANDEKVTRDTSLPLRVTSLHYVVCGGQLTKANQIDIKQTLSRGSTFALAESSQVVEGETGRNTEPGEKAPLPAHPVQDIESIQLGF